MARFVLAGPFSLFMGRKRSTQGLCRFKVSRNTEKPNRTETEMALLTVDEGRCYPSSPARDWNAWVRNLTSTKAPNPPHNTDALHAVKRPGCASAHGQGKQRITQLTGGRTCEGWRRRRELAPPTLALACAGDAEGLR